MENDVQNVFLIGAKSLGAYGGYETFVNKLTEYHQDNRKIHYHVACKANGDGSMNETDLAGVKMISPNEFIYHGARCFKIRIPNIGHSQAIYYDLEALKQSCDYIEKHHIRHAIIYIMACRVGPFFKHYVKRIHSLGGQVYLNPDGHEWMRGKWSKPVRHYWKISEQMMVKYSDLIICDSITIEKYIHDSYDGKGIKHINPKTTFIAYGAETRKSKLLDSDEKMAEWYRRKQVVPKKFYLVVGRFVPENNYETMIKEFMRSHTRKDFVIITNVNKTFLDELETRLHFSKDPRIKFVGTVYDPDLLKKVREDAYGYFHGHEVGGTNPSLLEALGSTNINLLLDVGFNREVAQKTALYWTKEPGNLACLIDKADKLSNDEIHRLGDMAKKRVKSAYSWQFIADRYLDTFINQ